MSLGVHMSQVWRGRQRRYGGTAPVGGVCGGCLAISLVLHLAGLAKPALAAESDVPDACCRVDTVSPPSPLFPGQSLRLQFRCRLTSAAELEVQPVADVEAVLLNWQPPVRESEGVCWEGDLTPLNVGRVEGWLACVAAVPSLPDDLPRPTENVVSARFLTNLYSPCRFQLLTHRVPLPSLAVSALPALPPGTPPFIGLLGEWSAVLEVSQPVVALREPVEVSLVLSGQGATALLRPPAINHPDLDIGVPAITREAAGAAVRVRWSVTAQRVPLEPLRVEFSVLRDTLYSPQRLQLSLKVLPEALDQGGAAGPPAVLRCFQPMPQTTASPRARLGLAGGVIAALGMLSGSVLVSAARRRDYRRTPQGLRQAALVRLHRARVRHVEEMPAVYDDLRTCFGLAPGASAAEIEAAVAGEHPQLAAEIRSMEQRRFASDAMPVVNTNRMSLLLRQLSCFAVLVCLDSAAQVKPPSDDTLCKAAAEAFRQRDVAQAYLSLKRLRNRGYESPELLMNLASASWYTGRRVEALALYERASRLAPRHPGVQSGSTWLRRAVLDSSLQAMEPFPVACRDRLRPDEWVFAAGVLAGLGGLAVGLMRWRRRPVWGSVGACAIAVFLCLGCAASQRLGPYRAGATARLIEAVPLRAAPAEAADTVGATLSGGTAVRPIDLHGRWLLVRTASLEGWVQASQCVLVW